jgi:hypothetical protein
MTVLITCRQIAIHSGIRNKEVLEKNEKHFGGELRKDVPICHGFRKFFTNQLSEAEFVKTIIDGQNFSSLAEEHYLDQIKKKHNFHLR